VTIEGYAGKYLQGYEGSRYTFQEWALKLVDKPYSIIVPSIAEEFGDVSFYQAGMQWSIYRQHARSAIIRIGQGNWVDSEFEFNYAVAKQNDTALGGYFFFDDRYTPQKQADTVIQAMQGKSFELELFIDWEVSYGGPYGGLKNVVALMKLLDAAGLHVHGIGMYTGYYYFTEHSSALTHPTEYQYLSNKPLWLAWYAAASVVRVPQPWLTWAHWQWGTPIINWGQPTDRIDMNKSNNTPADFTAKYLGGPIPPPPTGDLMEYKVTGTSGVNLRPSPSTSTTVIKLIKTNSLIWGVPDILGWIKGSAYQEPNGVKTTLAFYCVASLLTEITPPPPVEQDVVEYYVNGVLKLRITGTAEEFNA